MKIKHLPEMIIFIPTIIGIVLGIIFVNVSECPMGDTPLSFAGINCVKNGVDWSSIINTTFWGVIAWFVISGLLFGIVSFINGLYHLIKDFKKQ